MANSVAPGRFRKKKKHFVDLQKIVQVSCGAPNTMEGSFSDLEQQSDWADAVLSSIS